MCQPSISGNPAPPTYKFGPIHRLIPIRITIIAVAAFVNFEAIQITWLRGFSLFVGSSKSFTLPLSSLLTLLYIDSLATSLSLIDILKSTISFILSNAEVMRSMRRAWLWSMTMTSRLCYLSELDAEIETTLSSECKIYLIARRLRNCVDQEAFDCYLQLSSLHLWLYNALYSTWDLKTFL